MNADARVVQQEVEALALPFLLGQHRAEPSDELVKAGTVAHIQRQGDGATTQRFDLSNDGLGLFPTAAVGDRVRAVGGRNAALRPRMRLPPVIRAMGVERVMALLRGQVIGFGKRTLLAGN